MMPSGPGPFPPFGKLPGEVWPAGVVFPVADAGPSRGPSASFLGPMDVARSPGLLFGE